MKQLHAIALSDIGVTRSKNEDMWVILPEHGFFAIADGMGGHNAGEVAAQVTLDLLSQYIQKIQGNDVLKLIVEIRHAIEKINQHIFQLSTKRKDHQGMGTTLCALIWTEKVVIYAHVGDSRIYRFRKKKLSLLTEDHSLLKKWLSMGKIAKECTTPFPYRHVLTRSIGGSHKANPEIALSMHHEGDLFILCSDGLSDVISLTEMENILQQGYSIEKSANLLIETAKNKGGSDNMTVIIVSHENISR